MCNTVVINNGEVEIETPQDFVNYFKTYPIKNEFYSSIVMEACLCQINVEESLKNIGVDYEWDGMDYNVKIKDNVKIQKPKLLLPIEEKNKNKEAHLLKALVLNNNNIIFSYLDKLKK